ncbi:MAG: hypothetical protein KGZ37_10260 [Nitrosarchaeum sp.]|nr:hypothetical protein [Nitrosarchaeum sp.]
MPINFKREGNVCDKCHKQNTEVGLMTDYTDPHDGYRGLLCSECIKKREKSYTEKCPKCKRLAYEHGGMSFYGEPPNVEKMCLECVEEKEEKTTKRNEMKLKIKNFSKEHWKFWIATIISILAIIIGLSRL